jgi:acetyl-CoA carboxylase biotin carboxylase subunit
MYVEKYILEPHHVEVQVFGDGRGGAIHLGERECSIQRRHQKVWEESPSPILETHPATRKNMFECAVKITKEISYAGAGTFEFIVDGAGDFYFLEMNTRLQVEHPVTEWVTGLDLVGMQLLLAAGKLTLPKQEEIITRGSSIEVRVYAEDPHHFLPAPGRIGSIKQPNGPFLRWDSAYETGPRIDAEVSMYYDPMIAKLSVWGRDRTEALNRIRIALDELSIEAPKTSEGMIQGSLKTNVTFLQRLSRCEDTVKGNTTTDLIPRNPSLTNETIETKDLSRDEVIAISLLRLTSMAQESKTTQESKTETNQNQWARALRWEQNR